MTPSVHLCLVLHNHQPLGSFEQAFEQAYQSSYLPFLELFEPYSALSLSLHTSGPLMMWLSARHPEYIDRLRMLIAAGRLEILGGPQYEPILPMLPRRDRIGQIRCYTAWLERTLGATVAGMWTPERVWEASMASDLVAAGIGYTVVDDFHFRAAGRSAEELVGYFLSEDDGATLRIFPGSERLRYSIPFGSVQDTIDHCWKFAQRHPGAVVTFGDDGEKFGNWPGTRQHVYQDGWLRSFFDALSENARWLHVSTLAEAVRKTSPVGRIYLSDCSDPELERYTLPAGRRQVYDEATRALQAAPNVDEPGPLLRGGGWRNLWVRYGEANEMYAYMMYVSRRFHKAEAAGGDAADLAVARDHLYRGQCSGPYWQGKSGGIYLPQLRSVVYHHLIQADTLLDHILAQLGQGQPVGPAYVEATVADYDFDLQQEVRLANDQFTLWLAPAHGGRLYQWDVRCIAHNLLATLQRRGEADHRPLVAGASQSSGEAVRVVPRPVDPEQRLVVDGYRRKSMLDHFFDLDITLDQVASGEALERGDFVDGPFTAKIRRASDRVQLQMRRDGNAWGLPLTITKAVTVFAGSDEIGITYLLENLPPERTLHFAVELNFAGQSVAAEDRFFFAAGGERLGHLGERINLLDAQTLGLSDQGLGLSVEVQWNRRGGLWAFPVETLSQDENGRRLVQQSVCVMPHWRVCGDAMGRWAVQMTVRTATASMAHPIGEAALRLEAVS